MKKTVLLIISVVVILMGVLALIPGINLSTEPWWHALAKIVVGGVGVWVFYKRPALTKTALLVIGILLALMGVLALIPGIALWTTLFWHNIVVIVVGLISIYLGATTPKE